MDDHRQKEYVDGLNEEARVELELITAGKKPYLRPEDWKPVDYAAAAPQNGVTLDGGPLLTCFKRNIDYLNLKHDEAQQGNHDNFPLDLDYKQALDAYDKQLIISALNKFGTTRKAAEELGVSQPTVIRKARKYGISTRRRT